MTKFSVLIPVFYKANPVFFKEALNSILKHQSCKPTEVVIIVDGTPTNTIKEVLNNYQNLYPSQIKTTIIPEHKGTGYALKTGIKHCSYELIARMDADDIAVSNRFEKQLNFMKKHPEIDVLGSLIEVFNKKIGDLKEYRTTPELHNEIKKTAKYRSPVSHPTIMFKKSKVLAAGNYCNDFMYLEDYALWIAMLQNGAKFHNLQEVLLHFRYENKEKSVLKRRGLNLTKTLLRFNKYAYKLKFYTKTEYYLYSLFRIIFHAFFPPTLFLWVHKKITRKPLDKSL